MQQNRQQIGAILTAAVIFAWVGILVTPALAKKAPVEVTGQITPYAPGDDGDIQAGVPFPIPRFTDNRNGTVSDNLTGLIWLKNASCDALGPNGDGTGTWQEALEAANTLASGSCGLTDGSLPGDWRLPNVKELQNLIDFGFVGPALSDAKGTAQWTEGNAFSGVRRVSYWSSTTRPDLLDHAWIIGLGIGGTADAGKGLIAPVWPVRGGQVEQ
jgi:hypothetical protein